MATKVVQLSNLTNLTEHRERKKASYDPKVSTNWHIMPHKPNLGSYAVRVITILYLLESTMTRTESSLTRIMGIIQAPSSTLYEDNNNGRKKRTHNLFAIIRSIVHAFWHFLRHKTMGERESPMILSRSIYNYPIKSRTDLIINEILSPEGTHYDVYIWISGGRFRAVSSIRFLESETYVRRKN